MRPGLSISLPLSVWMCFSFTLSSNNLYFTLKYQYLLTNENASLCFRGWHAEMRLNGITVIQRLHILYVIICCKELRYAFGKHEI